MTNLEKFAELFNQRNNDNHINITTGIVLSTEPLKVRWGENVIIESKDLIIANLLKNGFTVEYQDNNGLTIELKTMTIVNPLQNGDEVIMIPDKQYKTWYVLDKAVRS